MLTLDHQPLFEHAEKLLTHGQPLHAARLLHDAERLGADPNTCAGQRWTCYMLAGDYERAWQESDALRRRHAPDPHRVWNGDPLDHRRVMVRSVHGLGDAVQMLRYMASVRSQAGRLVLQVAPHLVDLARCAAGPDEVVAWEQERPFDVQLEITELPYLFRSTPQTLPNRVPYLHLPLAARENAAATLGPRIGPRIGLVWTSSAWDPARFLPLSALEPLFASRPDADFWCLQPSATSPDWEPCCSRHHLPPQRAGDLPATTFAACIQAIDLVIAIDSFAAHLAGALAKDVWVLLKHHADWRWMLTRSDTPWYPTMRLFRQPHEGAWEPVIAEVAHALAAWHQPGTAASTLQRK